MEITFYGHASIGVKIGNINLLVDPYISANPAAASIEIGEIPANYILITHAHGDHILDVESIAKRTNATIISNAEIADYYSAKGFQAHPMNHGGHWNFDFGKIKVVNAVHSSSFPDGTYGGNACGFVIETVEKNIYIAGDTALTMDMKLIPMRTKLDLAILPIGDNFTMDIEDAVIASDFVECNTVFGVHYDTFGYIKINSEEAVQKFASNNKKLILLQIGEKIVL